MKAPIIPFNGEAVPDYQPSIFQHTNPATATEETNRCTLQISQPLNDDPSWPGDSLSRKVQNVMGHISLSVEIMESVTNESDLKTCLDVITRSTLRINNLIKEFLLNQQLDALQEGKD